jgi:flagellar hook-associated protein 2
MDQLRANITRGVQLPNGQEMWLFEIGITTNREGLLVVDEQRLRQALETRGEDVMHLFTTSPGGIMTDANFSQRLTAGGIASRVNDIIHFHAGPNGRLITRAGAPGNQMQNAMLDRIQDMDQRIESMQRVLARREQSLFARFAAMEQAVIQSNQQMDMLWSMMGMGF